MNSTEQRSHKTAPALGARSALMAVRPTRHTESYDSACQELAAHFVMGEKGSVEHLGRRVHSLAGAVQEAVESWLAINPPLDGSVTSDARTDAP